MRGVRPAAQAGLTRVRVKPLLKRLALGWVLFLVYGTTIPFDLARNPDAIRARFRAALANVGKRPSISDAVSNFAVFVPLGLFLGGWVWAAAGSRRHALAAAGLSGFSLSVAVEGLQLLSSTRSPDFNDILADTAGTIFGAAVAIAAAPLPWEAVLEWLRRSIAKRPLTALAVLMAASVFVMGLSPYHFTIDVGNVKDAIKQARLIPFGTPLRAPPLPERPWKWVSEGLAWTLAGGILALALRELGRSGRQALAQATQIGALLSAALECAQVFVRGRGVDATSTLMAAAGCAAGASLVLLRRRESLRSLARTGLLCWGVAVALERWSPLDFSFEAAERVGWLSLMPFLPYFLRTDVNAVADVLEEMGAFVPIGALLAVHNPKLSRFGAAGTGFLVAALVELGQAFLPSRTVDVTDTLSAGAGAALGLAGYRWAVEVWRAERSSGEALQRAQRVDRRQPGGPQRGVHAG